MTTSSAPSMGADTGTVPSEVSTGDTGPVSDTAVVPTVSLACPSGQAPVPFSLSRRRLERRVAAVHVFEDLPSLLTFRRWHPEVVLPVIDFTSRALFVVPWDENGCTTPPHYAACLDGTELVLRQQHDQAGSCFLYGPRVDVVVVPRGAVETFSVLTLPPLR